MAVPALGLQCAWEFGWCVYQHRQQMPERGQFPSVKFPSIMKADAAAIDYLLRLKASGW